MHNMGNVDVKCLQFFRVLNDVYREGLEKREKVTNGCVIKLGLTFCNFQVIKMNNINTL